MEKWFKGWHHYYLGIILLILGFIIMGCGWYRTGISIIISGLITIVDDAIQHFKQRKNPEYHSPLHKLYGFIYSGSKFIRWLNKQADKLFGK